jgi:RimJ/RimL family protein N-acetyltransferase
MLRGEVIGLRARLDSDIEVFEAELLNDAEMRSRTEIRPWRPVAPGAADSPYRAAAERGADRSVPFSVVELATGDLAGEASLWGIDPHNRSAHVGITLRPAFRGKRLGTDVVRVLCYYAFTLRGLNRVQVDTLADNDAMIGAALRAGFTREGTLRQCDWVNGRFVDEVILGLLATEWQPAGPG